MMLKRYLTLMWLGLSKKFQVGLWTVGLSCSLTPHMVSGQTDSDGPVAMVLELIANEDKDLRGIGLEQIRSELPGEANTLLFANKITDLPVAAQPGLISALATRGDKRARPALLELLKNSPDSAVRVAVIQALSSPIGETGDLDLLLGQLSAKDEAEQSAARSTLVKLTGAEIGPAIAGKIAAASPEARIGLLEILVARSAVDTVDSLLDFTVSSDPVLRAATMKALGELAAPKHLPGLLQGVLKAERGKERDAAEKAVMFVCQRIEPADERSIPLLQAIDKLPVADQEQLLSTVGRVGGAGSLPRIEKMVGSTNAKHREIGLRALCNWPDATIAQRLIELVKAEKQPKQRTMLVNALIRVAPLPDQREPGERLELLKLTLNLCSQDSERLQVIKRAAAIRAVETLHFVLPFLEQQAFTEQACETIVELAHHRNLREPHKAEFDRALDLVLAKSKNLVVQDRATRYKKGQTWYRNQ